MFCHVRKFMESVKASGEPLCVTNVISVTAEATGLSERSVSRHTAPDRPHLESCDEPETRERKGEVPEELQGIIRTVICDHYLAHEKVTLDVLLDVLQQRLGKDNFKWSRQTLWRTLHRMGYTCKKGPTHYQKMHEKSSIIMQRLGFIREVQRLRAEGRLIWYQDETWYNKNMCKETHWIGEDGEGGQDVPQGKGSRFIVSHIGCADVGLLPGALYCVAVNYNKASEDYHNSMNAEVFLKWMGEEVFPRIRELRPFSAVVIDHATYHRTPTADTKPVWKTMNKQPTIDWLISKGVPAAQLPPATPMVVAELKKMCAEIAPPIEYEIVRLGRTFGIPVIFSPVAHPELNPIEEVWAITKSIVESRNGISSLQAVESFVMSELRKHVGR